MRGYLITAAALVAAATWYLVDGRYSYLSSANLGEYVILDRLTGVKTYCYPRACVANDFDDARRN